MEPEEDIVFLWKWRKYLLLLATLVASVTYVAGLNPPGGVWSEDGGNSPSLVVDQSPSPAPAVYPFRVGDPVLVSTYARRYTVFFYCNAAAFVASLVIIMFLLDRRLSGNRVGLTVLRLAMLLDLLALMAAFAAGSCRDVVASIYVSALFAVVFVYVALHLAVASATSTPRLLLFPCGESTFLVLLRRKAPDVDEEEGKRLRERRKFLLLLATFATPLTYGAGLAPPGGFWSATTAEHRAGAPLLHDSPYKIRYYAFFYANATSFVASLAIIMLLMSRTLRDRLARSYALLVCVLVELLGLMAAYAAGSCRWITTTVYIACLVGAVFLYIVLVPVFALDTFKEFISKKLRNTEEKDAARTIIIENVQQDKAEQSRSLVLLLATLAATVTYQAGLSPPGGVWPEGYLNHIAGNPVLHDMHHKRYMVFYHCNTAAFVASVVVIIIVQSKELSAMGRAALKTAMILDLFGLMGAYVAGSCRDVTTTIYVSALAVFVFAYAIAKVMVYTAHGQTRLMMWVLEMAKVLAKKLLGRFFSDEQPKSSEGGDDDAHLERKRKFLLQLAILAATVTYQTGLNPPGGFWTGSGGDRAGDPILLDHYGVRYQVFFYCNATGFMASVAVILLLVNQTLSKQGIRSKALHVCVIIGLLGLMGAYAAGSCRKLRTSIYVFALVAAVVAFLILQILLYVFAHSDHWSRHLPCLPRRLFETLSTAPGGAKNESNEVSAEDSERYLKRKYLMVLGILAASVTYQAGLAPPGGTWGDDDTVLSPSPFSSPSSATPPAVPGNPILLDFNAARYQAFFYCNATSFMASIVVILLLLQPTLKPEGASLRAMQTAVVLDLLGLLGAYAAGSCRDWETSAYVIALVALVVVFITIYALLSFNAVLVKAKELKVWKYFAEKKEKLVKYLGGSKDHDQKAITVPVARV